MENDEKIDVQTVRDNAQEIAVREAGEIARWAQVETAVDAVVSSAHRYIRKALPAPRSSFQNAADRASAFGNVEELLLRALAAIRSGQYDVERAPPTGKDKKPGDIEALLHRVLATIRSGQHDVERMQPAGKEQDESEPF